jgi:hypothetical protein
MIVCLKVNIKTQSQPTGQLQWPVYADSDVENGNTGYLSDWEPAISANNKTDIPGKLSVACISSECHLVIDQPVTSTHGHFPV